jgi:hypothetical protein
MRSDLATCGGCRRTTGGRPAGIQGDRRDRGAARFDIPREWAVAPGEGSDLCMHDRQPPDDDCELEFSLIFVPGMPDPGPDLAGLLEGVTTHVDADVLSRSTHMVERREALELVWLVWNETCHRDDETQRLVLTRTCLARGADLHAVLTMALWADDAPRFDPAWHEVLRSFELERPVDLSGRDPRRN